MLQNHLAYASKLEQRLIEDIDLAVIHCTELPDLSTARKYGERIRYLESGTGNSGHFYIEQNGQVQQWVPEDRIAHHVRGYNSRSIGIELVNRGRFPHWLDSRHQDMSEPYPKTQIDSLIALLLLLKGGLAGLTWIAGHEALDTERVTATDDPDLLVARKRDPGPLFPWALLLKHVPLLEFNPQNGSQAHRST